MMNDARTPTAIPAPPPVTLSSTDSARNWSKHLQPTGPDCHADADFSRPLGYGHQKDIHDSYATDEQRNRSDRGQKCGHHLTAALLRLGDLTEIAHAEVVELAGLDAVTLRERRGHLRESRSPPCPGRRPGHRCC